MKYKTSRILIFKNYKRQRNIKNKYKQFIYAFVKVEYEQKWKTLQHLKANEGKTQMIQQSYKLQVVKEQKGS